MVKIISIKDKISGKGQKTNIKQQSFKDKIEKWCASNRKIIIGLIILVSVLFRAGYFLQINSTHLVNRHLWTESDMSFFDQWAILISEGNLLSDTVLHPMPGHTWLLPNILKTILMFIKG